MKLTKDMLDFEKYDYFAGSTFSGKDPVDVFHAGAWVPPVDGACMYELARTCKPKPRYILLNEGERLQVGDQQYSPLVKSWTPGIGNYLHQKVEAGEVWRRKVQE